MRLDEIIRKQSYGNGNPIKYDHAKTKDENIEAVNESINTLQRKNEGHTTPAQAEKIAEWKGKINTAMEQENPTQADMDSIISTITSENSRIDPNIASSRAIKEMSDRHHISAKDLQSQIKANTKNVDALD